MLITPANLNIFFSSLDTLYAQAYTNAAVWNKQIATRYPTSTEQWVQGWIGMLDKLRPWVGARITRTPAPQTYGATVIPFEATYSVDQFKIEDDQYGIYTPIAQFAGMQAAKWPDYNVRDLIQGNGIYAGGPQIGTDGVTHWNTAHPVDYYDASKGTYCNDFGTAGVSVNGVTVGGSLSIASYSTLWENMASLKSESGEALGLIPDMLMVPAQLNFPGKQLTQGNMFAPNTFAGVAATAVGSMDNPLRGSTDMMMNPDIASQPTAFYMLVTKWPIKPFGFVERQAPTMVTRQSPTDPAVFDSHSFIWGVNGRGVATWALPFLSARSGIDA